MAGAQTLTPAQAHAFIDALAADNDAARRPCPDLIAWIAEVRSRPDFLQWEAERWDVYDGDRWERASMVEYANGQLAVVVAGSGAGEGTPRGVVMLSDGRFYPVVGNPSDEWSFALGDAHPGFDTASAASLAF